MRFKGRFAIAVTVLAALAASSVALAGGTLTGKYAATIKSPSEIRGKWVLTLAKGGTYTVAMNGKALARGKYSATAKTITFRERASNGCGGSGTYAWKKSGTTLRFIRKREAASCQARAVVLSHRFTQVR
jgi:hypothetical protein